MAPDFPIRLIFDDGECLVANSPEELIDLVDTIDTTSPASRVWVRDNLDRTVRLRMRAGVVEEISV